MLHTTMLMSRKQGVHCTNVKCVRMRNCKFEFSQVFPCHAYVKSNQPTNRRTDNRLPCGDAYHMSKNACKQQIQTWRELMPSGHLVYSKTSAKHECYLAIIERG